MSNTTTSSGTQFNINNTGGVTWTSNSTTVTPLTTNGNLTVGGSTTLAGTTTSNFVYSSTEYELWGEKITASSGSSFNGGSPILLISLLNMLGTKYWIELKRQGIEDELWSSGTIGNDLYQQIEEVFKKQNRKEKIDDLLKEE
jgi:hypothetical protein